MRARFVWGAISLMLGLVLVSGCHRKSDKVVQSCYLARSGSATGSTATCKDEFTKNDDCLGEQKKSDKPCPRENIVGGCKDTDYIQWFYNEGGAGYATLQNVREVCGDRPTLGPDGSPAVGTKSLAQAQSDTLSTALKTNGPKTKAVLAFASTLASKLPAPTGKVDLGGAKGNAIIVHKEDLADLEHPKTVAYRLKSSRELAACSRLVNGRKQSGDTADDLAICATEPFLLVVSVTDFTLPSATGSSVSGNTKTTFMKKGHITGDVFVFRLQDDKYVGSFAYRAENGPSVSNEQVMTKDLLDNFPGAIYAHEKSAAPALTATFELEK